MEWAAIPSSRSDALAQADDLRFCRHHLLRIRRLKSHVLSEAEERILAEKDLTGAAAWGRLSEQLNSAISVASPVDGEGSVSLEAALSHLSSTDRDTRRHIAAAITTALAPSLPTKAFALNAIAADRAANDRFRGYNTWLSELNLHNEISDESVTALTTAVRGRYEIVRRWYRLKAKLLGLERLADYDRQASFSEDGAKWSFGEAKAFVIECYSSFAPEFGHIVEQLFEDKAIDPGIRPGKEFGAFCLGIGPNLPPYVHLSYTGTLNSVLTMAHEVGHAIHFILSCEKQSVFERPAPTTANETAGVFGETLALNRMLQMETTPSSRLALLGGAVEQSINVLFRQATMSHFEELVHTARRSDGELSVKQFGDFWTETQGAMFGDSVEMTDGYASWWSYLPHFFVAPGMVYSYAYGQLLALAVYDRYERLGGAIVPAYTELLSAGGSLAPEQLCQIVGVDLSDPGFWNSGLDLVERQLHQAENAASEAAAS